jgi:hypothetical protein
MKLTEGNGKAFEKHPAGTPVATLIKIIDLGTQEITWQGATKLSHKIRFVWESTELMSDNRPFIVQRDFTASLNSKGNLRPFLEGWRGRAFNETELAGFDPKVLIGMPCLLSLVEDGEYTNINAAMRLPKGMEAPKIVGDTVFFSLAEFDLNVFNSLSEKVKEKIMKSPEYQSLNIEGHKLQQEQNNDLHADSDVAF